MIPLAGQNNIRVTQYHTHSGKNGNVGAGSIIVLRNPRGTLNEIRRVGMSSPRPAGPIWRRPPTSNCAVPYSLKNRGRAIARQDFESARP